MYTKRKQFCTCAVMLCLSVNVSAQTHSQKDAMIRKTFTADSRCIALAELAERYAHASAAGIQKVEVVKIANKHSTDWSNRIAKNIISLVYMMQLDEQMAAQLVYTKCIAGDYNPTVEEMDREMRK